MKKIFVYLFLLISLTVSRGICHAESKASYVFRHDQPKEYILEQTKNILDNYGFPIAVYNSTDGQIETDFHLIDRAFMPDFTLKYVIRIKQESYGARIDVTAITRKGIQENEWRRERDEAKAAWWIIKALVKRVGK